MNRDRAKELLPIIQAYADGKEIEFRHTTINGPWLPLDTAVMLNVLPNIAYEYRIKPRVREFWIHRQFFAELAEVESDEDLRGYVTTDITEIGDNYLDKWTKVREVL